MRLLICFLFSFLFAYYNTSSQNFNNLRLKEEFDIYNKHVIDTNILCVSHPNNTIKGREGLDEDGTIFGDGLSKVLEGYISMFEATGDKDYLNRFVWQSLCIMRKRHDIHPLSTNKNPRWANDPQMYHDGYIIAAFSRFIHNIKFLNPQLIDEPIFQIDEINPNYHSLNSCNCNIFGITFSTYGQYAYWLLERTKETFNWFVENGYWCNKLGFKQLPKHINAEVINRESGFVRAALFIGLADNDTILIEKARKISNMYKSNVTFYDPCNDTLFNQPLFRTLPNNSFWWYFNGRRIPYHSCNRWKFPFFFSRVPSINRYTLYVEDISHGSISVLAPIDFFKFLPNSNFTKQDMIKFRNTFTKNIFVEDNLSNSGVDGSIGRTCIAPTHEEGYRRGSIFFWAFLTEFDELANSKPNVYNILMEEYAKRLANFNRRPSGYWIATNKGHAELVNAQWQRENFDLILYNRLLPYNQNLFARGHLSILPFESTNCSFFEPKICDTKFIITEGAEVNISAGKSVKISHGFHAQKGSRVRIFTNPNLLIEN